MTVKNEKSISIAKLRSQLKQLRAVDRFRLKKRLNKLQRSKEENAEQWQQLQQKIEESI